MMKLWASAWSATILGCVGVSTAGHDDPACRPRRCDPAPEVHPPIVETPAMPIGFVWHSPYQIRHGGPPFKRTVEPVEWVQTPGSGVWLGRGCRAGWSLGYPTASYWGRTYYSTGPWSERQRYVDPSQSSLPVVSAPAPIAPPPADEGLEALRSRDYARAIAVYERRDQEQRELEAAAEGSPPVNRTGMRLLALAHAGAGHMEIAAEMIARAHAEDAALSSRTFDGIEVLGSRREMRRIVLEAVRHAKKSGTSGGWELAAILMEAEGRAMVAQRWRERWEREHSAVKAAVEKKPAGPSSYRMPATE